MIHKFTKHVAGLFLASDIAICASGYISMLDDNKASYYTGDFYNPPFLVGMVNGFYSNISALIFVQLFLIISLIIYEKLLRQ
jgi:hypothetical protein